MTASSHAEDVTTTCDDLVSGMVRTNNSIATGRDLHIGRRGFCSPSRSVLKLSYKVQHYQLNYHPDGTTPSVGVSNNITNMLFSGAARSCKYTSPSLSVRGSQGHP
jgi:hypothetical protein